MGYDLGEVEGKRLTVANILSRVDEEVLWRYYFGPFRLDKTQKSPFRIDPTPSFSIYKRNGRIKANDHGGDFSGDVFDYIAFKEKIDIRSALIKVNEDFGLGLVYRRDGVMTFTEQKVKGPIIVEPQKKDRERVVYEYEYRPGNHLDVAYWASFGISPATLTKYGVQCVNALYCNGYCCYTYKPDNPCYVYNYPSGNMKFYWPLAKEKGDKFRGNIDNDEDIQGYYRKVNGVWVGLKDWYGEDWSGGDLLVLTKAQKDIMLLFEYDIDSIAIHGEQHRFNADFMRHIKKRYRLLVSLYDPDEAGRRGAEYLWKEYGVIPVFIPEEVGCKDITDMRKMKGEEKTDEFVEGSILRLITTT